VFDLFHFNDLLLFQDLKSANSGSDTNFNGIETRVMTGLNEVDSAETAGTESSLNRKVDNSILTFGGTKGILLSGRKSGGDGTFIGTWDGGQKAGGCAYHGL